MNENLFSFLCENAVKKHWNTEAITSFDLEHLRPSDNRYDFKDVVNDLSEVPENANSTDMYSFNNYLYVKKDKNTLWQVISPTLEEQLAQFEKGYTTA